MTTGQEIIEILKTIISPSVVAIVIIVVFFKEQLSDLLKELANLIKRIKNIHYRNADIDASLPQPQDKTLDVANTNLPGVMVDSVEREGQNPPTTSVSPSLTKFMNGLENPIISKYENNIKEFLTAQGLEDDTPSQQKTEVILRYSAAIMVKADFDRIYLSIYGSQVEILYFLNSHREGVDGQILRSSYYDNLVKVYPEIFTNYHFEQYMAFLISRSLIVQNDNKYFISDFGLEFLIYINAAGLTVRRPY